MPATMDAYTPPDVDALLTDPFEAFGSSFTAMHSLPPAGLRALQLEGLRRRFISLKDRVGFLTRLADRQQVHAIDRLDDAVPLLFEHTVYKGYPTSLLRERRFDMLTDWLAKLTTTDLSQVDVAGCQSIDEWIQRLEDQADLAICHSSGTSGTISFVPWTLRDLAVLGKQFPLWFQRFGDPLPVPLVPECEVVLPTFRRGSSMHFRLADLFLRHLLGGDESRLHVALPGRVSADAMYLAGRLRAARAAGRAVYFSDAELDRLRALEAAQGDAPAQMKRFLDEVTSSLAGRRIFLLGAFTFLHPMAEAGLSRGLRGVFRSDSVVCSGGGGKGIDPPPDWRERLAVFVGVPRVLMAYGTSEISTLQPMCTHGYYHLTPWTIPFLLDPDTGRPVPRTGKATGRLGLFDLLPDTRWGGFVSGDEVTIHWEDDPCACGQTTARLEDRITRYSDQRGDDKITCAATPEAHEEAMAYLRGLDG